jgi:predicted nucleotidyltransferase
MIIQDLEELSNKKVDLVVEGTARKLIAKEIEKEKKLFYEKKNNDLEIT